MGVVVSQGIHNQVGIIFFQFFRYAVDKAEHQACGATLFGIYRRTVLAGAVGVVIVLRNRNDIDRGVFFQNRTQIFDNLLVVLLACEAGVGGSTATCFGQRAKRVNKQATAIGLLIAVYILVDAVVSVNAVFVVPFYVELGAIPSQAACLKIGGIGEKIAVTQNNIALGDFFKIGHKVAHTCVVFQKLINAIENTATVSAANAHTSLISLQGCFNQKAVIFNLKILINQNAKTAIFNGNALLCQILCKLFACIHFVFALTRNDVGAHQNVGIGDAVAVIGGDLCHKISGDEVTGAAGSGGGFFFPRGLFGSGFRRRCCRGSCCGGSCFGGDVFIMICKICNSYNCDWQNNSRRKQGNEYLLGIRFCKQGAYLFFDIHTVSFGKK